MESLAKVGLVIGGGVVLVGLLVGLVAVAAIILALPTMLLWNWLMPEIFGLKTISFWQALGLLLLSGFLLRGVQGSSSKSKD